MGSNTPKTFARTIEIWILHQPTKSSTGVVKLKPLIELTALCNVVSAFRNTRFQPSQFLVVSAGIDLLSGAGEVLPRGSPRAAPDISDRGNQ